MCIFFLTSLYFKFCERSPPTSAVWRRCAPAAVGQAGDLLGSVQQEVLLAQVVDVKADLIFSLLHGHHVALIHLTRRLAVHLYGEGKGWISSVVMQKITLL